MEQQPKRKNNHLPRALYGGGVYFVTVVTKGREPLFGCVDGEGKMRLNETGSLVRETIREIEKHFPLVRIKESIVMPDHVHGIIEIEKAGPDLHTVVGTWKAGITRRLGRPIWQRSYYDHIIRNEKDYKDICEYIKTNPLRWALKHGGQPPEP